MTTQQTSIGCQHEKLLVRIFEEQTGRVYLSGSNPVEYADPPLGPEFSGAVEVECQEEGCEYRETFNNWEHAPQPMRDRIEAAIDAYYAEDDDNE